MVVSECEMFYKPFIKRKFKNEKNEESFITYLNSGIIGVIIRDHYFYFFLFIFIFWWVIFYYYDIGYSYFIVQSHNFTAQHFKIEHEYMSTYSALSSIFSTMIAFLFSSCICMMISIQRRYYELF